MPTAGRRAAGWLWLPTVPRDRAEGAGAERWTWWSTAITVVVCASMRVVRLSSLPGELYGDIAIVYEYVSAAKGGHWPDYFVLSTGPLYHYMVVPIVWCTGLDFQGLKVASALVSLGVLGAIFGLARELVDRQFALVSAFVAGVSSWLLIFSRLGGSLIVTPLVSAGSAYFAIRSARHREWWNAAACGVVASAGLYAYPPTFVLAPVMLVTLVALRATRTGIRWREVGIFSSAAAIAAVPFACILIRDRDSFFSGYIGSKFDSADGRWSILWGNLGRGLLALHVRGDEIFRSNPAELPHLDRLSGVLFLVGIAYWLRAGRRQWAPLLLVPFVLLQLPSILVFSMPGEVPSAGRTLLVTPFAYILVASGLWWPVSWIRGNPWAGRAVLVGVLTFITVVNGHRYFVTYADGLPDDNTPFGRIIADYLHGLPDDTHAVMVDFGWGEHGQPEPKGIQYLDAGPVATSLTVVTSDHFDCDALASLPRPAVLIWAPADEVPVGLEGCRAELRPELHSVGASAVFRSSLLAAPP
jgi:hypothetical protein